MYLRTKTGTSTGDCWGRIARLKEELRECDGLLLGAGAGLSAAAGFEYAGERFKQNFGDFEARYDFHDMYSGGFYPYGSLEEYWAYWSRHIWLNRYTDPPKPVYEALLKLVENKDYFVLTTNVDHCFQKAGFDKKRLFYTQGDYGLWQCSLPCCQETWDNRDIVRKMTARQQGLRVPTELVPHCPRCERPLTMNLRSDDRFVEDEGWHAAAERYGAFLRRHSGGRLLLLELGVGFNTPGIIKYPFWRLTACSPKVVYACVNRGQAVCPEEIEERAICIDGDIGEVLTRLKRK